MCSKLRSSTVLRHCSTSTAERQRRGLSSPRSVYCRGFVSCPRFSWSCEIQLSILPDCRPTTYHWSTEDTRPWDVAAIHQSKIILNLWVIVGHGKSAE